MCSNRASKPPVLVLWQEILSQKLLNFLMMIWLIKKILEFYNKKSSYRGRSFGGTNFVTRLCSRVHKQQ